MNIMVSIVHLSNLSLINIAMLNGFLACNEIMVYQLTVSAMLLNPLEESVDSPGLPTYKLTYRLWSTTILENFRTSFLLTYLNVQSRNLTPLTFNRC
jgi:hypothetical protein